MSISTRTFTHRGYEGSIEVSAKDNVYHGKIMHIKDLVTYEAKTLRELKIAFEDTVDDYLLYREMTMPKNCANCPMRLKLKELEVGDNK